jgi:hypothetical protein
MLLLNKSAKEYGANTTMATIEIQDEIFRKLRQIATTNYRTPELQIAFMLDKMDDSVTLSIEPSVTVVKREPRVKLSSGVSNYNTAIGACLMSMSCMPAGQSVTVPEIVRHMKLNFRGIIDTTKIDKNSVSKNVSMLRSGYNMVTTREKRDGRCTYEINQHGRRNAAELLATARLAGAFKPEQLPVLGRAT